MISSPNPKIESKTSWFAVKQDTYFTNSTNDVVFFSEQFLFGVLAEKLPKMRLHSKGEPNIDI